MRIFLLIFIGKGHLTFHIRKIQAFLIRFSNSCDDTSLCDLYIKLFINDVVVSETKSVDNESTVYPQFTYISGEIEKTAKITVELRDDDGSTTELIYKAEGNIQSFIDNPIRTPSDKWTINKKATIIETSTTWLEHFE